MKIWTALPSLVLIASCLCPPTVVAQGFQGGNITITRAAGDIIPEGLLRRPGGPLDGL